MQTAVGCSALSSKGDFSHKLLVDSPIALSPGKEESAAISDRFPGTGAPKVT